MAAKSAGSITYKALMAEIKKKDFKPVYLLQGEEPWFIDRLEEALEEHALEEHERDFNLTVMYGRDSSFEDIINAAKRFPMMAERQLIIVREAQDLEDWKREEKRDRFEAYFKQPQTTTVLVLAHKYKALASNMKVSKAIAEVGLVFHSKVLNDQELTRWIADTASTMGCKLPEDVVRLLSEYLGSDLDKVVHAIEKLHFMVGDEEVTTAHVEKYIGISKDYNILELQDAIAVKDHVKAQRIARYFGETPKQNNINMSIGFFFSFWSKLLIFHQLPDRSPASLGSRMRIPGAAHSVFRAAGANYDERKVIQNISLLRSIDQKLKGRVDTSMEEADLYRMMVHEMMN